jgi:hypothetical protein
MDVTTTFLPVAGTLIDRVFPSPIIYRRLSTGIYDPATGTYTKTQTDYTINAGVLSRVRGEEGGTDETWHLTLWIHHGPGGLPVTPATGDEVVYDGITWKVDTIDPTYSSAALIASKIVCRSPG